MLFDANDDADRRIVPTRLGDSDQFLAIGARGGFKRGPGTWALGFDGHDHVGEEHAIGNGKKVESCAVNRGHAYLASGVNYTITKGAHARYSTPSSQDSPQSVDPHHHAVSGRRP